MTPEEAKLILQCRRPCGKDDHLPVMREAWAAVESCPATMAELEAERALDGLIAERVRSVDPPEDLRRCILIGAKVTPAAPWKRHSGWLSAAAALVVAGAILAYPRGNVEHSGLAHNGQPAGTSAPEVSTPPPSLADFRAATTSKLTADRVSFQASGRSVEELQSYLNSHSQMRHVPIPHPMSPLTPLGCEIFQWRGYEVTLICFSTPDYGTVHLFAMNAADLPGCSGCTDEFTGGWQTVAWREGDKVLLIAGKTAASDLRRLIAKN